MPAAALAHAYFPLSGLTKPQVRQIAREAQLHTAEEPESMGLCFVGKRAHFDRFLDKFITGAGGQLVTQEGAVVGNHAGVHTVTVGQRVYVPTPSRRPSSSGGSDGPSESPTQPMSRWYVQSIDPISRRVVVAPVTNSDGLWSRRFWLHFPRWITADGQAPVLLKAHTPMACTLKLRHPGAAVAGELQWDPAQVYSAEELRMGRLCSFEDTSEAAEDISSSVPLRVTLHEPARAVTPGQIAAIYVGDRCLGGAPVIRAHTLLRER